LTRPGFILKTKLIGAKRELKGSIERETRFIDGYGFFSIFENQQHFSR